MCCCPCQSVSVQASVVYKYVCRRAPMPSCLFALDAGLHKSRGCLVRLQTPSGARAEALAAVRVCMWRLPLGRRRPSEMETQRCMAQVPVHVSPGRVDCNRRPASGLMMIRAGKPHRRICDLPAPVQCWSTRPAVPAFVFPVRRIQPKWQWPYITLGSLLDV